MPRKKVVRSTMDIRRSHVRGAQRNHINNAARRAGIESDRDSNGTNQQELALVPFRGVVDQLLDGSTPPDKPRFIALTVRASYSPCATILKRACEAKHPGELIPTLLANWHPVLSPFRLGGAFGLVQHRGGNSTACTLDHLRADQSEASRAALAATSGEIEWISAPRRVRAAWCLAELVIAFKRQAA